MYDVLMQKMRHKGWIETNLILKAGILSGTPPEIGPGPGYLELEWLKRADDTKLKCLEIGEDMMALAKRNAAEYGLSDRVNSDD